MRKSNIINMGKINQEIVSASVALDLLENRNSEISKIEFMPPELGDDHFGQFLVEWRNPVYKMSE